VRRRAPIAFLVAVALGSGALGAAVAHGDRPPDAEIFATSTTAIIIDPADPRLQDRLLGFRREVQRIIRRGGGVPRRSRLVDDHAERRRDPVDAVEVEVPGVDAQRLRFGFVADAEARQRLMGGSVTLGGRLVSSQASATCASSSGSPPRSEAGTPARRCGPGGASS
jgi:hypothetical protein